MTFNFQPVLRDETLHLRPLQADDRDALTKAASDPLIWAGHPAKTRHRPEVFAPYFDLLLKSEATLIALEAKTGAVLGCSRFYVAPDMPEAVSIGFTFLIRDCWGGDVNRQMKKLMLDHIFADRDEAWFHIDRAIFVHRKPPKNSARVLSMRLNWISAPAQRPGAATGLKSATGRK